MSNKEENKYKEFMDSLNEKEKIALNIAKKMLESSFDIEKSIVYIKWKKNQKSNKII